ncbi:hypothetical protein ACEUZ9_004976 [Paracoccus litorisediminis]|jgi:hypothetical protein|uniref:Uncharacterized protein n=1 Tax=Paracoccus litorisediminis TaxID=2006130 RepID=A0A844HL49_9RHOB|nr:hypothetical protein [Paracoccus litorisediminis]MTH59164.1 hypothetical protein [Paracoccus litorisediminis]
MKFMIVGTAILAGAVALPVIAQTNLELAAKIIGNGVEPASEVLPEYGYDNVRGQYWWNAAEKDCVYASTPGSGAPPLVRARPTVCGMAMRAMATPVKVCRVGAGAAAEGFCGRSMAGR